MKDLNPYSYDPFEEPRQRRQSRIPIDPYDPAYTDQAPALESLTPEERDALLDTLGDSSSTATGSLFDYINAPASAVMDVLAGVPIGSKSTGQDALRAHNLLPSKEALGGWGRPLAGFATEATLDPLNLITFGGGAVNKAAKAASMVNVVGRAGSLLDDAARAASRAAIQQGARLSSYGDDAARAFQRTDGLGLDQLTDSQLAIRPLVGRRAAQRDMSLRTLIDAQDAGVRPQVMSDLQDYLGKHGSDLASQLDTKLGADIGVRLPFTTTSLGTAQLPGGAAIGDMLDRAGQITRWSPVGRAANAVFNQAARQKFSEGDQIFAQQLSAADAASDIASRKASARILAGAPDEVFTPAGGQAFRAKVEGYGTPQQLALAGTKAMDDLALDATTALENNRLRSEVAGIGSRIYADQWGTGYFSRGVVNANFDNPEFARSVHQGRIGSVMTADTMARRAPYRTPGGTHPLNVLSIDRQVAGPGRLLQTDRQASEYIKNVLDREALKQFPTGRFPATPQQVALGLPGSPATVNRRHTLELARTFHQLSQRAVDAGVPMFGRNPMADLAGSLRGRERAIGRSTILYDRLGATAKNINFKNVSGGGHVGLQAALKSLRLKSTKDAAGNVVGARAQLLDRLAPRFPGIKLDDLRNVSIPGHVLKSMQTIAEAYDVPGLHHQIIKTLDDITKMWKGSILAWPARFSRDWMSGMFSNMLEVGSPMQLRSGYSMTKRLMQGEVNEFSEQLAGVPRYESLSPSDRLTQYRVDLSGTGLLQGRRIQDVGGELDELGSAAGLRDSVMPGHNPRTTLGYQVGDALKLRMPLGSQHAAYSELGNMANWRTAFGKLAHPIASLADTDVSHPILRWSAKLGDNTDTINRMAGYNALLLQGVTPQIAAERMLKSQVDYGNLSVIEKEYFRRLMPFYSYTSRISKYVAEQLVNDPGGRLTQFGIRLPTALSRGGEDNSYVPASIQQKYGFSLEPYRNSLINTIAPSQPGVKSWLSDVDLPGIDQINQLKLQRKLNGQLDLSDSAWSTFQNVVAGNAHPLLKSGVEALTGQDLYTQRPKKQSLSTLQAIGRGTGLTTENTSGDQWLGSLDPLAQLVPFAPRALQLGRRLTDTQKVPDLTARLLQNAINATTGIKVQNIGDESRRYDVTQKIDRILAQSPATRSMERVYIPSATLSGVDPEIQKLYALKRQLAREAAAEKKLLMQGGASKPKRRRRIDQTAESAAIYNPLY